MLKILFSDMVNPDNVSGGVGGNDLEGATIFVALFEFVLIMIMLIIIFVQYFKISNLKDKLKETNYNEKGKEQ